MQDCIADASEVLDLELPFGEQDCGDWRLKFYLWVRSDVRQKGSHQNGPLSSRQHWIKIVNLLDGSCVGVPTQHPFQ
jgi:hypothetical protein